jgi:hypothetical protein
MIPKSLPSGFDPMGGNRFSEKIMLQLNIWTSLAWSGAGFEISRAGDGLQSPICGSLSDTRGDRNIVVDQPGRMMARSRQRLLGETGAPLSTAPPPWSPEFAIGDPARQAHAAHGRRDGRQPC